jgi:solute carrier family 10 (sodium/bile acid cotransporter), member 7
MSRAEEEKPDGGKNPNPDEPTATLPAKDENGVDSSDSIDEIDKGNGTPSSSTSSTAGDGPPPSRCRSFWRQVAAFYWEHEFLILIIASIGLARAYPPLGAIYVAPDITASWVAVVFIFLLAGLSLKTSEFSRALENVKFNVFVQVFSFGVVSSLVFGLSKLLILGSILDENLANGMVIAASLPMTISMVLVMTKAAGGDEAAAVFNSAFGNLVGVFLSPALILGYLGVSGNVNVGDIFYKLTARVVLPVVVGQVIQYTSKAVVEFLNKYKSYNRQAQQYALVFIVYTVFAEQFMEESQTTAGSVFIMSTSHPAMAP